VVCGATGWTGDGLYSTCCEKGRRGLSRPGKSYVKTGRRPPPISSIFNLDAVDANIDSAQSVAGLRQRGQGEKVAVSLDKILQRTHQAGTVVCGEGRGGRACRRNYRMIIIIDDGGICPLVRAYLDRKKRTPEGLNSSACPPIACMR
jgi:hypothetical protein